MDDGNAPMILVTGASGFVGTRLCEHLRLRHRIPVRAVVRRPERAARLARLDVELVGRFDAAGCDAVVHLAYATEGSARARRRSTAELARCAAVAAGSRRLVHVSSTAIWGFDAKGTLDERTAPRATGHPYVDGKIAAEAAVQEWSADHVILRPTNVWGPWGPAFTVAPILALREHKVALVGEGAGPANLVFVDNLARAIVSALEAPAGTYVINDGDRPSWRELYERYAKLGGWEVRSIAAEQFPPPPGRARRAVSELAAWPAIRSVGRRVLPVAAQGRVRSSIAGTPDLPSPELAALQMSRVSYRTDAANEVLGYSAEIGFEEAFRLTTEWLRFARLL
jgi:nucleoside-diphosphate-sugar epimerase